MSMSPGNCFSSFYLFQKGLELCLIQIDIRSDSEEDEKIQKKKKK